GGGGKAEGEIEGDGQDPAVDRSPGPRPRPPCPATPPAGQVRPTNARVARAESGPRFPCPRPAGPICSVRAQAVGGFGRNRLSATGRDTPSRRDYMAASRWRRPSRPTQPNDPPGSRRDVCPGDQDGSPDRAASRPEDSFDQDGNRE